jgi:hypothetical protein
VWSGLTSLEYFESCSTIKQNYSTKSFDNILIKGNYWLYKIIISLLINIRLGGEWKFSNLELEILIM